MPSDQVFKGKLQEFRPADLPRIIETSTDEGLVKLGLMAADSLAELRKLPPGQARDEAIAGACQTVEDVRQEQLKRRP